MRPGYGLILLLLFLSGCTEFHKTKAYLLPPSVLGMEELAPRVFVDKEMSLAQREEFRQVVYVAGTNIANFYGSIASQPVILACSTDECFSGIGGGKSLGKDLGKSKILISRRGLTIPILTHEWSHAELRTRMDAKFDGIFGMNSIPTWFDEGLAVVVSEEPRHSEKVWERIVAQKMDTPRLDDLVTLKGWNKAAGKYGDVDCALGVPGKINVVYATAGHEVRSWHRTVGREGLLKLIDRIKSGENFENSYAATSK